MYTWRFIEDKTRNIGVHEVSRGIENEAPYTIIISDYAAVGDRMFFNDLFWPHSWGSNNDILFSMELWKKLGFEGTLTPDKIEHDLDRSPTVYRKKLEDAMHKKFGVKIINNSL